MSTLIEALEQSRRIRSHRPSDPPPSAGAAPLSTRGKTPVSTGDGQTGVRGRSVPQAVPQPVPQSGRQGRHEQVVRRLYANDDSAVPSGVGAGWLGRPRLLAGGLGLLLLLTVTVGLLSGLEPAWFSVSDAVFSSPPPEVGAEPRVEASAAPGSPEARPTTLVATNAAHEGLAPEGAAASAPTGARGIEVAPAHGTQRDRATTALARRSGDDADLVPAAAGRRPSPDGGAERGNRAASGGQPEQRPDIDPDWSPGATPPRKPAVEAARLGAVRVSAAATEPDPVERAETGASKLQDPARSGPAPRRVPPIELADAGAPVVSGPAQGTALRQAGQAYRLGDFARAQALYGALLKKAPNDPGVLEGLARSYQARQLNPQAIDTFERLLAVEPNNTAVLLELVQLAETQPRTEAFDLLARLRARYPRFAPIYAQAAMIHARERNFLSAADYMTQAVRLDPDQTRYIYNLASIQDRAGNQAEAIRLYREVLRRGSVAPDAAIPLSAVRRRLALLIGN